ncbi:GH25 family lysozyme [Umezawaea sp. Da 62-37]|uniref:GH25 family lysozyme n=1 Tax=Umezawaea sp. Da 62-37 TaxID=3075927 RepID=UPI0028F74F4E|nr:GH25 family lysozyme [Umezawaea sp. Da 62-37]WNV82205.1 GH25 family lysozyme [Umezawaea sp. Da 62-37]
MTDYGIDISSHQGEDIGWTDVAGHNISFCSVKLTEGTTYINPAARSQVDGARSVGISTGGYHYAHPGDPRGQAHYFADQLDARGLLASGSLWPMLDMEEPGFPDPNGWIREFIAAFRERTGAPLLVYANVYWLTALIDPNQWADDAVLVWAAQYNGDPGNPDYAHPRLAIHQHTNSGHVNGFSGLVDRNATMDGWSREAFVIGNGSVPSPTAPPWPLPNGHYFGLITGPDSSHGGYYATERGWVAQIQRALQAKGFAPLYDGWADGVYEQATADAVAAWQREAMPGTTRFGEVWWDDWAVLLAP